MSGRLQEPAGRVCSGKRCFCGGRAVPRLSLTSLGSTRAGCSAAWRHLLPKEANTVGRDSQPSWYFHVSPHPKTHPHPTLCPSCAAHLTVTQTAFGKTSHHPHFNPAASASPHQLPPRMAATGQILPALSLAPHKPSLAALHQRSSPYSQAGSFPNRNSSFWQKLPASDPDFTRVFLTAGCDPARQDSPSTVTVCLLGTAPRGLKFSALKALSLGLFIEGGFPKDSYFWAPQSYAKNTSFLLKEKT